MLTCNLCLLSKWSQAKKYVAKVSCFLRCISCAKSCKLILFWTYAPLSSWQLFAWMKHPCESGISEFAILILCKKKTLDFLYFQNIFASARSTLYVYYLKLGNYQNLNFLNVQLLILITHRIQERLRDLEYYFALNKRCFIFVVCTNAFHHVNGIW